MMKKIKEPVWLTVVRLLLAAVFLFSGFTKAVDPMGFGIKIDEYFTSFNIGFLHPIAIWVAVLAISFEFVLGFMLLFRIKVKLVALGYLLFMLFFFCLTAWLAFAEYTAIHYPNLMKIDDNVVKDCGCFGAAIEMSNLETFLKNVAIMIPTLIVFYKRKSIPETRLTELGKWVIAVFFGCLVLIFQFYCYRHLPVIDFSDWKRGTNVNEMFIDKPTAKEIVFLYKNKIDSTEKLLNETEMMTITEIIPDFWDTYDYVDREDRILDSGKTAVHQGFNMLDTIGADHAPELLSLDNPLPTYIVFMPNLEETNENGLQTENMKHLIEQANEGEIILIGVSNSSSAAIQDFITQNNIKFPIYFNPVDPVKGPFIVRDAIRSNPGIILIEKGIVKNKWNWRHF